VSSPVAPPNCSQQEGPEARIGLANLDLLNQFFAMEKHDGFL
jgi:hypothetical protein